VAKTLPFERQALHAYALSLQQPLNHDWVTWFRLPPFDLLELLPHLAMGVDELPQEAALLASIGNDHKS
jgi:23S rRNA pseudouridine1911/1915/1917 synthase